jgi:hypothetical protein
VYYANLKLSIVESLSKTRRRTRRLMKRPTKARIEHQLQKDRLAADAKLAREKREMEAARARAKNQQILEAEKRELKRQEAQARPAGEHRRRMAAIREEQELAKQRERDLEQMMQKLRIVSTRKEKGAQ